MRISLIILLTTFCISIQSRAQTYTRIENGLNQTIYFDSKDSVIRVDFLDSTGKLADNEYGYATLKYKRDRNGNIIEQAYFHSDGKPAVDDLEVSKWVMKYNERNQKIYQAEYGTDGKILISNAKFHHIVFEWTYDKKGNLKKMVTTEYLEGNHKIINTTEY